MGKTSYSAPSTVKTSYASGSAVKTSYSAPSTVKTSYASGSAVKTSYSIAKGLEDFFLLLQNGTDFLLFQNGDKLILESGETKAVNYSIPSA